MTTTQPITDADRQDVVTQLEAHVGAGRLTLDEFADRARTAYHAHTRRELANLTHDLPTPEPAGPPAGLPPPLSRLAPLVAVAVLTLLLGSTLLGTADAAAAWTTQMAQGCH